MEQKKIVIIGAGVVGSSLAYFLSKMGQQNITVIEQGPLVETGGSTSHAPGLVFQLSFSKVLTKLANSTVSTFKELSTNERPSFYSVGSVEVANTPERLEDLKRKAGVAASWGMEASILTPEECSEKSSLIDSNNIYGGLFTPSDGIAKPLNAVQEMMEFAKSCGVKFYGETEVIDIDVQDGHVKKVITSSGEFDADLIVCCAGFWGPRIGEMVGVTIPLQPMAHQFVWTEDLKEFAEESEEVTMPLIRHQDSAMYYRQVFNRLGVGSYQHRALPVEVDEITKYGESKEMPSVKPFTPEDFEKPWQDATRLMPSLKDTSITKGINGIFSFTPDEMPLLGESHKVKGFWVAEAIWVTHSAGVAKEMAEWIVNGVPTLDLELCDINRFDDYAQSPSFYKARSIENYLKVYDIHHPYMPHDTGRNVRVSPYYIRQEALGAVYNEKSGWEQPQWYKENASLVSTYENEIRQKDNWAAQFWSPIIEAEQIHAQKFAGLFDATASRKYLEVSGEGTIELLQQLTTSNIDISIGTFTKTFMLHESAGIKDEITVIRTIESTFIVLCSGAVEASWIKKHVSPSSNVVINDLTAGMCSLLIKGSKTKEFMQSVLNKNFEESLEVGQVRKLYIDHIPVLSFYQSINGSESWELFTTSDQGLGLWDVLYKEGQPYQLIAAGERALDGLRMESLIPKPGKDFWSEMTPYEIESMQKVDLDKHAFIGKDAVLDHKLTGPRHLLATLVLDDPSVVIMGYEPVYDKEKSVGFVTSFGYSYERKTGVAFAILSPEIVKEGNSLSIEYFGEKYTAKIISQSAFITH
ncbi:FAD-dependent oxidoreductase [Niallia sp. 01092]|uniref:FAD-dependent oxidoreductase n=1 Tax=unclassified Niallia TaxID=2837522 RepID=UPI003FD1BE92